MSIELKIKVKNLADEARTIRIEEQKLRGMEKWNLQHHRKTVVRDAARRSLIAYQVCRGKDWRDNAINSDDGYPFNPGDRKEVIRMIRKYGTANQLAQFEAELSGDNSGKSRENACSHAA